MEDKTVENDGLDLEDTENDSATNSNETKVETKKPAKQSRETNAYYAELRRKEKEAEYKRGLREGIKTNPYTDTPIADDYDLEVYQEMKKLDDEGKDPVNDFPTYYAKKQRQAQTAAREKEEQEAKAREDVDKFFKSNPNVSKELLQDEEFLDYAEGKFGNKSLEDIYKGYLKLQAKYKPAPAVKKEEPKVDKKMPTSQPSGASESKTISKMSDEEIEKAFNAKFKNY